MKSKITNKFGGGSTQIFGQRLHQLSMLRNFCAHGSSIYDQTFLELSIKSVLTITMRILCVGSRGLKSSHEELLKHYECNLTNLKNNAHSVSADEIERAVSTDKRKHA